MMQGRGGIQIFRLRFGVWDTFQRVSIWKKNHFGNPVPNFPGSHPGVHRIRICICRLYQTHSGGNKTGALNGIRERYPPALLSGKCGPCISHNGRVQNPRSSQQYLTIVFLPFLLGIEGDHNLVHWSKPHKFQQLYIHMPATRPARPAVDWCLNFAIALLRNSHAFERCGFGFPKQGMRVTNLLVHRRQSLLLLKDVRSDKFGISLRKIRNENLLIVQVASRSGLLRNSK